MPHSANDLKGLQDAENDGVPIRMEVVAPIQKR